MGKLSATINPIIQFVVMTVAANPPVIEIGYNETVNIDVGMWDQDTNDFMQFNIKAPIFKKRFLEFQVIEYPGGNEHGKWYVTFHPTILHVEKGAILKTNCSISLRSPRFPDKPIQNGILKIRLTDTFVFGNLWRPPKGFPTYDRPLMRSYWTFLAWLGRWGRQLSGKVLPESIDIDVLIKVKPVHKVKFDSVPSLVFSPDKIVSVPVSLQNLGNYNDTFSFRVAGGNDNIEIGAPVSVTLAPGEVTNTYLGIYVRPSVFDYGTIHQIRIEAYSIDQPNVTIDHRTVVLESKGVYFSELSSLGIFFIIFILILIGVFLFMRRKKQVENICVKPDKPWDIPEEKNYLEEIKKVDSKKYKEVLQMMNDEYRSALLWYDSYVEIALQPRPVKREKVKKVKKVKPVKKEKFVLFKKDKKPLKEEKKSIKKEKEEKELIEKLQKKKIEKKVLIDKKAEAERLKKQRSLLRIRLAQERQRKKVNKLKS